MFLRKKIVISFISILFVMSFWAGIQTVRANGWNPLVETVWLVRHLGDSDINRYM